MKKIKLKTFLYHFCENIREEKKYCFILGAGASKPSGIRTGGELVQVWMKELGGMYSNEELDDWKNKEKISSSDLASSYSKIYDKRFELDKKEGFAFLEKEMDGKEPSCGYSVLAQILDQKPHKIVITTNFDSLTENALFIYTQKKPLVVVHESLANYITPLSTRPIIVKVHRDLFFSPKSESDQTNDLADNFKKNLASIFKYYTPLVIGYGGNDGSLMGFLETLEEIEGGIFWFYREADGELNHRIQQVIEKNKGYAIPIRGYDELMIQIGNKLKLERLDKKIVEIAEKRAKNYREQIENVNKKEAEDTETKEALSGIISRGEKDWWYYELSASKQKDPDKKEEIYKEGLKKIPESHQLYNNYANFLYTIGKDYDKAEEFYKKVIDIKPNHVNNLGSYANFLYEIRKDYDKAEELYKKVIELDPENANHVGNYIRLLIAQGKLEKAGENIPKAFELNQKGEPLESLSLELWFYCFAVFYKEFRDSKEQIEKLLKKGVRSPGWYLKDVLGVAKKNGHPEYEKLCEYEKMITTLDN